MTEGATAGASRENRKAIPVSCALHRGPRGFANLVAERKHNGEIVLDPHVTGACVIIFDEDADHPYGVYIARCGQRLFMGTSPHDEPPGWICLSCLRWTDPGTPPRGTA